MLKLQCDYCGGKYQLADVRVDEHWRESWSWKPVYCYCPHCDAVLKNIRPDAVDLAKNLTVKNFVGVVLFFGFWLIGIVTSTLTYIGPVTVSLFGLYLVKYAKLKDHRLIGCLLIILGVFMLVWLNAKG